ncbi:NAD(P)/FAD-dependent oxidoreductase [Corynebacterium cystitidis]|uniref:NAD(P)/FAD-dependent oxidoreductase n=1 Tax=Corynebacterium cystitidis TaxID=35757 RepID=UPI00211E799E|nr:NAD(P)/FAD-dependent oxidoreductase [Corynebacterium cystitidis]
MQHFPAIIIGAGQAGLATAYYLRRQGIEPVLIDAQPGPGGAWQQYWDSLTLFSNAGFSNLPGMPMPAYDGYPPRDHVVEYFAAWEDRYEFDIRRPYVVDFVDHGEVAGFSPVVDFVDHVDHGGGANHFTVHAAPADDFSELTPLELTTNNVVVATGTWTSPFVPSVPGTLEGQFWHSANYPGKDTFRGTKVAVVGGGNSGAQIAAELSEVAEVVWLTRHKPRWMPDNIDGADLFKRNRPRYLAIAKGEHDPGGVENLGDIVMVPEVKRARDSGRLNARPMVDSLDDLDGVNHLIWCTGFRPSWGPVRHLLDGAAPTVEGLFLVGYSEANGPGADTIMGVGPFAKQTAAAIAQRC